MLENQRFYNIELPDAFKVFGDSIYKTKSTFNNNILKKSINEINSKSDITVSFKFEKYFAAQEKIRFFIDGKKPQKPFNNLNNRNKHFLDIEVDPDPYVPYCIDNTKYFVDETNLPF